MVEKRLIYESSKAGQILSLILMVLAFATAAKAESLLPINTDTVKRSVVFIFGADASGEPDKTKEIGTGFLVEVPLISDPTKSYLAMVTARHIVDPVWACTGLSNPSILYARLNKKAFDPDHDQSGVDFVKVTLVANGRPTWKQSDKETVDVAVIPIESTQFLANDIAAVRIADFATPEEVKEIGIGDDVVSAGLVPGLSGQKRNYPFFKFGRLSSIPAEDTLMSCPGSALRPRTFWYVAATLIAGNSGSPIFVLPPGNNVLHFGNTRPFLVGLQSMSVVAGDIAGMTPVQYIFDVIDSLHLKDANMFRGLPPQAQAMAK